MFFFGKRKIMGVMVIFVLLALFGWLWKHRESVPFISQPLSAAAAPFQYGTSRFSQGIHTGIAVVDQALNRWQELEALRSENGALRAEQAQYGEILAENIRLRKMLDFKSGYTQFQLLGASVISRDYGVWTDTVVIDRGEDSGIKKYMPVIVPQGLVGFVSEVYANSARVQLLTDPRTSVGAIVQRPASRVASLVTGSGNFPGQLLFVNIPKEADVVKGDMLVTSGYGGVYPHGLLIGTVGQVESDPAGIVKEIFVQPSADFRYMEEVFVITDHIQKTAPAEIKPQLPVTEPPMNPNARQAGDKQ